jgi:hypothetical protein
MLPALRQKVCIACTQLLTCLTCSCPCCRHLAISPTVLVPSSSSSCCCCCSRCGVAGTGGSDLPPKLLTSTGQYTLALRR